MVPTLARLELKVLFLLQLTLKDSAIIVIILDIAKIASSFIIRELPFHQVCKDKDGRAS